MANSYWDGERSAIPVPFTSVPGSSLKEGSAPGEETCQKNTRSVDQPLGLLTQPAENMRLGQQDRVQRQTQLLRRLRRRGALHGDTAEGGQRGRLEQGRDQLHQAEQHVAVVFLVPLVAQLTVRI